MSSKAVKVQDTTHPSYITFNRKTYDQIEELAKHGLTEAHMAAIIGVSLATWDRKKKQYPKVQEVLDRGRANGVSSISEQAFKLAKNGNTDMIKFWLKAKADWNEKQEIEHTVKHVDPSSAPSVGRGP